MSLLTTYSCSQETALRSGTIASLPFFQELVVMCYDLRWMMALCGALIIADLKFGLEKSIHNKEEIRYSNAFRRTLNKAADYICWILLGGLIGKAVAEPMGFNMVIVAAVVVAFATLIEIDSIIQNYHEARGVKGMSLRVVLSSWLNATHREQMAESLHDSFKGVHKEGEEERHDED